MKFLPAALVLAAACAAQTIPPEESFSIEKRYRVGLDAATQAMRSAISAMRIESIEEHGDAVHSFFAVRMGERLVGIELRRVSAGKFRAVGTAVRVGVRGEPYCDPTGEGLVLRLKIAFEIALGPHPHGVLAP